MVRTAKRQLFVVGAACLCASAAAWVTTTVPNSIRYVDKSTTRLYDNKDLLNPFESKIPPELRDEIYRAEANTPAAKDRSTRVAIYTLMAITGIGLASFNGFLTDLRDKESALAAANEVAMSGPNSLYILQEKGFGWVLENPLFKFMFTNKLGGILTLLFGGGSGLMAEAELDTKRVNAEKIYEELERRREQKLKKQTKRTARASGESRQASRQKKRRSGKEKKRIEALSEVVLEETVEEEAPKTIGIPAEPANEEATTDAAAEETPKEGILGKMKDLYDKADSMAASQALILNKNLEEAGVVEKITDESGLKVIGREEAKKLQEEKQNADDSK